MSLSPPISPWGGRWPIRVGIMGGSFNPAHSGHLHVARQALHLCALDQVWLLVSPGNPLKATAGMATFEDRLASAKSIADGHRILAVDLEKKWKTRYTIDTVKRLKCHFPLTSFVWIMGADVFAQLPQWKRWKEITRLIPLAVYPRPDYTRQALKGQTGQVLAPYRLSLRQAKHLAITAPPAWSLSLAQERAISSTEIRALQRTL